MQGLDILLELNKKFTEEDSSAYHYELHRLIWLQLYEKVSRDQKKLKELTTYDVKDILLQMINKPTGFENYTETTYENGVKDLVSWVIYE